MVLARVASLASLSWLRSQSDWQAFQGVGDAIDSTGRLSILFLVFVFVAHFVPGVWMVLEEVEVSQITKTFLFLIF